MGTTAGTAPNRLCQRSAGPTVDSSAAARRCRPAAVAQVCSSCLSLNLARQARTAVVPWAASTSRAFDAA